MNIPGSETSRGRHSAAIALSAALALGGLDSLASTLKEPPTVFYGRIIGTGSSQPYQINEGTLEWTVQRPGGQTLPLKAKVWPLNNGEFSYRLDVPHEALALGLVVSESAVPLKAMPETYAVGEIRVNGLRARVAGSSTVTFETAQIRRASTHRIDLEVAQVAPDSDKDGLPDWWEAAFGGDLMPGADADGDGLTNLQEYLAGTNPRQDSKRPSLATAAVRAVVNGTAGIALRALDSDTAPEALRYTLTQAPTVGELRLRNGQANPTNPDTVLAAGATFTQRDVLQGRLILVHSGESAAPTSFGVSLHDGAAGTTPTAATVAVAFDRTLPLATPAGASEAEAAASRIASVIWNGAAETAALTVAAPTTGMSPAEYTGTHFARYGAERSQLILGGLGPDTLAGGMAGDVLAGGGGQNRLTGGGGGDRFVFTDASEGTDTVTDFNPAEGDVLDLDPLFTGRNGALPQFVQVVADPAGVRLLVDADGPGAGQGSRGVVLAGFSTTQADLNDWVDRGALRVGTLTVATRLALEAIQTDAAENGPRPAELRLSRKGVVDQPLDVALEIRGSAVNGVDYATVPTSVRFAAGQRELTISIQPYPDNLPEPAETVEVTVLGSPNYEIATARAVVSIADLRPVVRIEALESLATRQPANPAVLLISRDTIVDRSLLVRVDFGGSAVNGTDYQALSRFVNLLPGQTTALLSILPASGSTDLKRPHSVLVSLVPDDSYLVGSSSKAEAVLVSERTSFGAWRTANFPGQSGDPASFAAADPGGTGISNAQRYAFGMDPQKPDRARMPRPVVRDGYLTVDVWRRPEAQDVVFVPEVSSSLGGWRGGADLVERISVPEHARNPEVISYRVRQPLSGAAQMFLNLRVEIRP